MSTPGVYRFRDLVGVPGLLSLLRVPLAAAFPRTLGHPGLALALLVTAGVSDVADGWYARRFGRVTPTGAAVDPITDKVFVLTVVLTLVFGGLLSRGDVFLLSTREIAELPLVLWLAASAVARRQRAAQPSANGPGKLATTFQFATATAALFHMPHLRWMIVATALVGLFAAATYWYRALREARVHAAASPLGR